MNAGNGMFENVMDSVEFPRLGKESNYREHHPKNVNDMKDLSITKKVFKAN